ncbi:MAG TPA: beta/gamma crystallin-related protein [Usitatibacteraceae bacterium]|nr:beta/gamma crystallin-related protein [Usitatibacteraceae bacterium]
MNALLKIMLAGSALAISSHAISQVTFYGREGFEGRSFTTESEVANLEQSGFNDRASSAVVVRGRWEACEDAGFGGRCVVLRPGQYPSLAAMNMGKNISSVRSVSRNARLDDNRYAPLPPAPQITFYAREGFAGRSFTTDKQIGSFERNDFNDTASSVVVVREFWEVCEDAWFAGRCVILRPGRYPSLAGMGLSDSISSVRVAGASGPVAIPPPAPAPPPAAAQVTFYEHENYGGRSFITRDQLEDFDRFGFNDRASSAVVTGAPRVVCEHPRYGGRCVVLKPGSYPSMAAIGLNDRISSVRMPTPTEANLPAPSVSQVTFYEHEGFGGRSFVTREQIDNFERFGFNDRASSVVVVGESREVCEDVRFYGRCVVLREGNYPSLATMGLNDRISSVRAAAPRPRADNERYLPAPVAYYDYRRRNDERLYEARVISVRAVVGMPEQRCWVEREQVVQEQGVNVPGAVAGAIIGGILGHQIGGGRGKDVATAGGAITGAAVGANVGRDNVGQLAYSQDVERCTSVSGRMRADYWDVIYSFRNAEHRVQMNQPPGPTITVNGLGEPRV